jgi:hypothetical protein
MPMPGQWDRIGAQQQQEQQEKQANLQRGAETAQNLVHTMRNFNDQPVGSIVGAQGGAPVVSSTTAAAPAAAGAAAGAGEAAGAAAAGGEAAGGLGALAELAPLAALA